MKNNRASRQGGNSMNNIDRQLISDTLAEMKEIRAEMKETNGEMRELKGEMREFKNHVIGRVEKLEKKEGERSKERISVFSVIIATCALAVSIIVNFFIRGR
jgi:hypothetical protein